MCRSVHALQTVFFTAFLHTALRLAATTFASTFCAVLTGPPPRLLQANNASNHETSSQVQRGLRRQQREVAHGGPAVRAVPGRVQVGEVVQDEAHGARLQRAPNHDGGAAGARGQHGAHPASRQPSSVLIGRMAGQGRLTTSHAPLQAHTGVLRLHRTWTAAPRLLAAWRCVRQRNPPRRRLRHPSPPG